MDNLESFQLSPSEISDLRRHLLILDDEIPFQQEPKFASLVACHGMAREIGSVNDELARFIFSDQTGLVVEPQSLYAELITWNGLVGIQIRSHASDRLQLRARHLRELLHPNFSFRADGSIKALVFFPEIISKIAELQGATLVVQKSWAMNSIFGGFDPAHSYYQTNFWELENNDVMTFSKLIMNQKLAFLGTHDLIAHVAGIRSDAFADLGGHARTVHFALQKYFQNEANPSVASLIIPYTIGVVLDDLAQPPTYASTNHQLMLTALLQALDRIRLSPRVSTYLVRFPETFEQIIRAARGEQGALSYRSAGRIVENLIGEIQTLQVRI